MTPYLTRNIAKLTSSCEKRAWFDLFTPKAPEPFLQRGYHAELVSVFRETLSGPVVSIPRTRDIPAAVQATRDALQDPAIHAIFGAIFVDGVRLARPHVLIREGDHWAIRILRATPNRKKARRSARDRWSWWAPILHANGVKTSDPLMVWFDRSVKATPTSRKLDFVRIDKLGPPEPLPEEELERLIASQSPPEQSPGPQCFAHGRCPHRDRCHEPVYESGLPRLPGISGSQFQEWIAEGYTTASALHKARNVLGLGTKTTRALDAVLSGDTQYGTSLAQALSRLTGPAWSLDFELYAPAFPAFLGAHPFEQLPVQFSLHHTSSHDQHSRWLYNGAEHPGRPCALALLEILEQDSAPIMVYSPHEHRILSQMAAANPDLKARMNALISRLVDLQAVIAREVYHPDFNGSLSLKRIYPALVPGGGWDDLGVQNGQEAHDLLDRWYLHPEERSSEMEATLHAYCARDTLALLHIREVLLEHINRLSKPPSPS